MQASEAGLAQRCGHLETALLQGLQQVCNIFLCAVPSTLQHSSLCNTLHFVLPLKAQSLSFSVPLILASIAQQINDDTTRVSLELCNTRYSAIPVILQYPSLCNGPHSAKHFTMLIVLCSVSRPKFPPAALTLLHSAGICCFLRFLISRTFMYWPLCSRSPYDSDTFVHPFVAGCSAFCCCGL